MLIYYHTVHPNMNRHFSDCLVTGTLQKFSSRLKNEIQTSRWLAGFLLCYETLKRLPWEPVESTI